MNNKIITRIGLLLLVGTLSSCGYSLRETYDGDAYNSPVFGENYYRHYDASIDPNNANNSIDSTREVNLTTSEQPVAIKYEEASLFDNAIPEDPNDEGKTIGGVKKLRYLEMGAKDDPSQIGTVYGPTKKMASNDEMFSYGYVSKLFDGQMFCNGYYQLSRVQIDEGGFGVVFEKEVSSQAGAYFALNFKAAGNYINEPTKVVAAHKSAIVLHIGFYLRNGKGFDKVNVSYKIDEVPTNGSEGRKGYIFFAFKLDTINIMRCAGISVSYDLLNDAEYTGNPEIEHSLMLYEMLLPKTIWR